MSCLLEKCAHWNSVFYIFFLKNVALYLEALSVFIVTEYRVTQTVFSVQDTKWAGLGLVFFGFLSVFRFFFFFLFLNNKTELEPPLITMAWFKNKSKVYLVKRPLRAVWMLQDTLETCRHSLLLTLLYYSSILEFYHVIWHYAKPRAAKPSFKSFVISCFNLARCYIKSILLMHA